MNVTDKAVAWEEADRIFPTDYEKDEQASQRAGYDIYRHPTLNPLNQIADLGDRLEVTTADGAETVNIWITPKLYIFQMVNGWYYTYDEFHGTYWPATLATDGKEREIIEGIFEGRIKKADGRQS